MEHHASIRQPLILGDKSYHQITEDISRPVEGKANRLFKILLTISSLLALWGVACFAYTIGVGIGVWGLNKTVGWAWDITNFVWWVGIGHAGTLISAILLLFRQRWRMSINRYPPIVIASPKRLMDIPHRCRNKMSTAENKAPT